MNRLGAWLLLLALGVAWSPLLLLLVLLWVALP